MTAFLNLIVGAVLNWLYNKGMDLLTKYLKAQQRKKKIDDEAKRVREKTEKANTPKEREDAAGDVINNFRL
jgi:hypothetical protein